MVDLIIMIMVKLKDISEDLKELNLWNVRPADGAINNTKTDYRFTFTKIFKEEV